MSKRSKSPHGRTSDRQLRAEDSSDDLRRYQECAKKLDECSKNLLRLCQVSGELNNLHDDDIERAANEIIRTEEEEAKKIAAELLHQKGLLHRNIQEPESATRYLNQDDCGPRPRSGGAAKPNAVPSGRRMDYEVPKTLKNQQQQCATDQRSNVHQQIINQPPYAIFHCEERVPCPPCPPQYSSSGMSRPNPCTDYSSSQVRVPPAGSSPYVTKGDGSERRPPYFRQAQQQPAQSTWGRPEPVWNTTVSRKTDPSGLSNPRLLDHCKELARNNDMAPSSTSESTKRGAKPQTIHLTAGTGRTSDPPVHIVITAIANDCSSACDNGPQQPESNLRDPVYSDNEFAEDSAYSLGNKGPSAVYSSPTGDDRVPQKYFGSQQKLVDRGSDAYVCPDDVNPSSSRPTYKEILDTILSQRPHDAESLLKSKGILNCAIKCWEKTKNSLRAKYAQQSTSRRDLKYQTTYECQEQTPYRSETRSSSINPPPPNCSTESNNMQQNPCLEYSKRCAGGPVKTLVCCTPGGSRQRSVKFAPCDPTNYREQMSVGSKDQGNPGMHRTVILKCCQVPTEAKSKQVSGSRRDGVQSRPATYYPADSMKTRYRNPTVPCRDRQDPCEQQQFLANPNQFGVNQTQFNANPPPRGTRKKYQFSEIPSRCVPQQAATTSVPKTYQCTQICPPSSNPSTLLCAPAPPVNRTPSKSNIRSTVSEMDSSILLAIAKAAINLSLEKQEECDEEEGYDEDCDSGYPDMLDTIFKE